MQTQVPGTQGEEELPFHRVQDQRERAAGGGGQAWRARWKLRCLHCLLARRRVPLRGVWFWLRHWWELPEEQDLLHLLVTLQPTHLFLVWFCSSMKTLIWYDFDRWWLLPRILSLHVIFSPKRIIYKFSLLQFGHCFFFGSIVSTFATWSWTNYHIKHQKYYL